MTDKFLQKILDSTAEVRDQGVERQLSEKAKLISEALATSIVRHTDKDWSFTMGIHDQRLLTAFKVILGDDWYESQESQYQPVKSALVLNNKKSLLITKIADKTVYFINSDGVGGSWPNLRIDRPATVGEIYDWYAEFLK